jgi:hypothetical protein
MIRSIEIHGNVVVHLWENKSYQGGEFKFSSSVNSLKGIGSGQINWSGRIGSINLVSTIGNRPGVETPPPIDRQVSGEVRVYEDGAFNGNFLSFDRLEVAGNLNQIGRSSQKWNDRISSIYIKGNFSVIVFQDASFRGDSLRIDESVSNMRDLRRRDPAMRNWNDAVSSFEIIPKDGDVLYSKGKQRYAGTLYEHENFQGKYLALYDGQMISNLRKERWNDILSSIMVERGYKIILYKARDFQGSSITLDLHQPSLRSFPGNWNDEVSSLKVVRSK